MNGQEQKGAESGHRIVIVTGLSGAGKSTALNVLEDLGFEAVDNLPISLLPNLLIMDKKKGAAGEAGAAGAAGQHLAVGVDSRTRAFVPAQILETIDQFKRASIAETQLLFMECDDQNLTKRFSETRRRHPLAHDRPVIDGITAERAILREMKEAADIVIDTSGLTVHETRARLEELFSSNATPAMTIVAKSFGYGNGLPRDADLVFDVRFLKNPHYEDDLRALTGIDPRVADYVRTDENFDAFFERVEAMLVMLLPLYREEGKAYLTIAFGCTGGRHRSVMMAEAMGKRLDEIGYRVSIVHRDAERT